MPFFPEGSLIGGEYRVERLLGSGGMAMVYLCRDSGLDTACAVKVLNDSLTSSPEARCRFLDEARTMARLRHPGIMPVLRVIERDDLVAFVMPYLPGHSLAARLDAAPSTALPADEALALFAPLVAAVRFAHEASPPVIHRDIKPDNVYLVDQGGTTQVLLMDFGIAKVVQEGRGMTQTGSHMGTVAYMAPEQIASAREVRFTADIWSLGVVLFELLCGRRPFQADSDLLLPAVVVRQPVPTAPLASCHPALRALVLRCLAKDPAERYPNAAALDQAVQLVAIVVSAAGATSPPPWGPPRPTADGPDSRSQASAPTPVTGAPARLPLRPLPAGDPDARGLDLSGIGTWASRLILPIGLLLGVVLVAWLFRTYGAGGVRDVERHRRAGVGFCYGSADNGVELERAHDLLEQAAETGDPMAKMWVACSRSSGSCGFDRDTHGADELTQQDVAAVKRRAEEGHAEALVLLGLAHEGGVGVATDLGRAVSLYQRSVTAGHGLAMYRLGELYLEGRGGLRRDRRRAIDQFEMAARRGIVKAADQLQLLRPGGRQDAPAKANESSARKWRPIL